MKCMCMHISSMTCRERIIYTHINISCTPHHACYMSRHAYISFQNLKLLKVMMMMSTLSSEAFGGAGVREVEGSPDVEVEFPMLLLR